MSPSSWLLFFVLAALAGYYPWLVEALAAGTVAVLQQPAVLAVLAVLIVGHKVRRRWV